MQIRYKSPWNAQCGWGQIKAIIKRCIWMSLCSLYVIIWLHLIAELCNQSAEVFIHIHWHRNHNRLYFDRSKRFYIADTFRTHPHSGFQNTIREKKTTIHPRKYENHKMKLHCAFNQNSKKNEKIIKRKIRYAKVKGGKLWCNDECKKKLHTPAPTHTGTNKKAVAECAWGKKDGDALQHTKHFHGNLSSRTKIARIHSELNSLIELVAWSAHFLRCNYFACTFYSVSGSSIPIYVYVRMNILFYLKLDSYSIIKYTFGEKKYVCIQMYMYEKAQKRWKK